MFDAFLAQPQWFSVIGLAIDIIAVVMIAWDLLIRRSHSFPSSSKPGDLVPEPINVWNHLREHRITVLCVLLLLLGFALQLIGNLAAIGSAG